MEQLVTEAQKPLAQPASRVAPDPPRKLGRLATRAAQELTTLEIEFTCAWAECYNATVAYERSHATQGMSPGAIRTAAQRMSHRPHILRFMQELQAEAARDALVDVAALLRDDLELVQAAKHAKDVSRTVIECCRHCHGVEHKYQWRDLTEYCAALEAADADNEARVERKLRPKSLPTDAGGYGFLAAHEPDVACPKCEGHGNLRVVFADMDRLTGPAARLVRGVKQTATGGIEVLLHDVDKAKERLLRAAGAFGDDAASVARAAAAGGAAGAAAATALAARVTELDGDDLRRGYLSLVQS